MEYSLSSVGSRMFWLFCLLTCLQSHFLAADTSSSSKAKAYAKSAEVEFSKMNEAGLKAGIAICEQVCTDPSFRRLQIDERLWIYKMLSTAYQKAGAFEKQEKLISGLLDDIQFSPYWVSLKVHLGTSYLTQERNEQAERLLKSLMSQSMQRLSFQDSEEIARLYSRIQQYYDKKLADAEAKFLGKDFAGASRDFGLVHDASLRRAYPQTYSTQSFHDFLSHLELRLAQCLLLARHYDEAIQIAAKLDHPLLTYQATLLQGIAYKRKGRFDLALQKFAKYTSAPGELAFTCEALWEASFAAMKRGDLELAKEYFQELQKEPIDGQLFRRKKVLQILISIEEGKLQETDRLLNQYEKSFSDSQTRSKLECQYLKGYLHFKQKQFETASRYLVKALAASRSEVFEWQADACYLLGCAWLEQSQFEKAADCFETISSLEPWADCAALGLARCHAIEQNATRLSSLITESEPLVSIDCLYEMKLLLAILTDHFEEVLESRYQSCHLYPRALIAAPHSSLKLQRAFDLVLQRGDLDVNFHMAAEILQTLHAENEPLLCCKLLDGLQPTLTKKEHKEEASYLYLKCLFDCLKVANGQDSRAQFALYDRFLNDFPSSRFTADVLHLKARTLLLRGERQEAKAIFAHLAKENPNFAKQDEVLFFLAALTDDSAPLYQELFTKHPNSPFSSEAYFRYFPESAYKQQDIHAIAHLKKMPSQMQQSIYGIFANLYIAEAIRQECPEKSLSNTQLKLLQEAIGRFNQAIDTGEKLLSTNALAHTPKLARFLKTRLLEARLERAEALFILANTGTRSQSSFDELRESLEALQNHIKRNIDQKFDTDREHLLLIWQEAALQKSRAHLLQGEEKQAREELANLIEYMKEEEFEQGDALVKALCQLSVYYTREGTEGAIEQAEAALNKALTVQARGGTQERLLEIYIAKSNIHRKKEEFDRAMILLSSVINDISASSLRIQAMYLRAELYELKGRRDLCMRQLQATAKKGGEWGNRAQKKLEEEYGFE